MEYTSSPTKKLKLSLKASVESILNSDPNISSEASETL